MIRTSALSDPNCSTDERYDTLFEYIQDLSRRHEKKNESLVCPTTITITSSAESHLPERITRKWWRKTKRTLKTKRTASSASTASTQYLSPFPNTPDCDSSVVATPFDDKNKDPDWGPTELEVEKDWTKTPIGGLGKRRSKTLNKSVCFFY